MVKSIFWLVSIDKWLEESELFIQSPSVSLTFKNCIPFLELRINFYSAPNITIIAAYVI